MARKPASTKAHPDKEQLEQGLAPLLVALGRAGIELARHPTDPAPLAMRPKEAAKVLGIGQRKLWSLTHPRGPILCVRAGRCVLYPYRSLQAWLAEQVAKGGNQ
jgi:hypothetical protein